MQVIHKNLFGRQTFSSYISSRRSCHFVGISATVLFSLISFAVLFPVQIKTNSSYAADFPPPNYTSTTSLNLTLTDDTLALDLVAGSTTGSFAASSPANFTVSTNNVSGYTLSIKSKVTDPSNATQVANASRLVNTEDSTEYISSIASSLAPATFSNSSNTQYNNQWGYLPSKLNSSSNSNYLPAPSYDTATILNTTACANGTSPCTSNTDSYSITLGARVNNALSSGTYEHVFTIIALGNPINYSITYNANDGANGANTTNMPSPNPQTGSTSNTTISLSNDKPQRAGYDFKGWCNVQPTADPNYPEDQNCPDIAFYQPGGDYRIYQTSVNTINLYATWWQPNLTKLDEAHATMQQMSPMACYNSAIGDTATLTDDRDGTTRSYTVAKLADGLCWMTTNLNLGADHNIDLTPNDTDITTNFTLPASSSNYSSSTASTNINAPYNLNNHTIASHTVNGVTYTTSVASYYTYAAATADTSTYNKSSDSYVNTSICPKNWDLPTESQYLNLRTKGSITSASTAFASPNTFTYGGFRNGESSFYSETSCGYYWTSRNVSSIYAYWTNVSRSGLYSSTATYYKYYGAMIRCVASQGITTVNYNGNGTTEYPVTGTTAAQENVEINSTMARANGFTRTGWGFNGWNTAPDGSGIAIAANGPLSNLGLAPDSTITLYAQWLPQYTITYTNNCKSWASSDSNCTDNASNATSTQAINLDASGNGSGTLAAYNKFSLTGWKIKEWTTNADGTGTTYPVGSTYNVTGAGAGDGITLYAHWVPVYTVQYDGNGADNPNGMGTANATTGIKPVRHYNVAEGDTFDLFASNFKRTGYGFVGWSTDSSAWTHLTDNDNTNDPKIWGPNEAITAPAYNGTPITTLYAVWIPAEKDGNNNPVYLQSWSGCSAMTATTYNSSTGTLTVAKNTVTALTDKRDGMVYAVAKLVDGDCWMIENLRLDTAGTVGQNTIDSSVTNESLSQGYGGVFHGLANPETSNFSSAINTENSLYTTASGVTGKYQLTIDSSYSSYLNYLFPRYNNANITWNNNASSATTPTGPSQNVTSTYAHTDYNNYVYSYGNYYTWAAVIANTIYYQNYNATGFWPNNSDSADTSLCPTGWKLPLGAYRGSAVQSFSHLDYIMGGNGRQWRSFPNNFVYSGYFYGSSAYSLGKYGNYWSSSAYSSNVAYKLSIAGDEIDPGANSSKDYGLSVRCVIDKSYRIVYDGNGATAGSMYSDGQVVKHAGLYDGDTITLIAPNYQKDGYGFAGWSPSSTASVGGTDPIYGPNETITVSSSVFGQYMNNRRQVTLYAVWVAKETNVTMQTFNSTNYAAYNSAPIGTVIALEDTRDNDVYAVAKLADGKWWMIENLRLDAEDSRGTDNIAKAQGYGDATSTIYGNLGKFIGLADSENNNFSAAYGNNTEPTEANSIYYAGSQSGTATINISQSYGAGFRIPRYNNNNTNRNLSASYNGSGNTIYYQWYGYGNYYNWAAAMANTGYYSSYNNSDAANTSICPKGWRLPLGYTSSGDIEQGESDTANRVGSFSYLDRKLGGTGANQSSTAGTTQSKKWRSFPYNFVYSGRTDNQSIVYNRNNNGIYWSSSVSYDRTAYTLSLGEDAINPGRSESSKASAKTVRCIAQ